MSIQSEAGPVRVGPVAGSGHAAHEGHDHDHGHDHLRHHGADDAVTRRLSRLAASPFLASALDRLAIAALLAGLVWIGVVWAVR